MEKITWIENASIEMHIELCGMRLSSIRQDLYIISAYRPPKGSVDIFLSTLDSILKRILKSNKSKVLICTDCNIDYLAHNKNKQSLLDVLACHNLKVTNTYPTRIFTNKHGHTSISCLDYIFCNAGDKLVNVDAEVINPIIADHFSLILPIRFHPSFRCKSPTKWFYKRKCGLKNIEILESISNPQSVVSHIF